MNLEYFIGALSVLMSSLFFSPLETEHKLNVYKTFKGRSGRRLNFLCTFSLLHVSRLCMCIASFCSHIFVAATFCNHMHVDASFCIHMHVASFSVLTDQQFVDHERQYLASELEKSICSNQKMSHLQSILFKEKSLLQEENENLKHIIAEKDVALEDIEREYRTLQDNSRTKIENNDSLQLHLLKTQQLCKDNAEKSQMIIQYQHQIIMLKDDQDLLHKEITSLKLKNSSLLKKMNDLKTDYDWQRSCSQRLSEQVDQSKDELKQLRKEKEVRKKIFDLQFELAQVNEEKDDALHKMKEYREVTSALKVKYDKLKQEKNEEAERRGEVGCINLHLEICLKVLDTSRSYFKLLATIHWLMLLQTLKRKSIVGTRVY